MQSIGDHMQVDADKLQEINKIKQMEEMKKQLLNKILTKEAFERLSRLRMVNQQLVAEVELYLLQIYQAGRLEARVTDAKLREILKHLTQKKDTKITRR